MADVWVVVAILAFFGLCIALVWGCDKIIGSDETEMLGADVEELPAEAVSG